MTDDRLRALAAAAGIAVDWQDAFGKPQVVTPDTLRAVLAALGLPARTPDDVADSLHAATTGGGRLPPLVTAWSGQPAVIDMGVSSWSPQRYRIRFEDGGEVAGLVDHVDARTISLPAVSTPGYHCLSLDGRDLTLAVAPPRCFGIGDAMGPAARPWGLAAQLYGIRRKGDGGIGDFTGLADLARAAAAQGADALAVSPVHAMFAAEPRHFSPYSPSSRLWLNVLHIDPAALLGDGFTEQAGDEALEEAPLIDWPAAAARRMAHLRELFDRFEHTFGAAQRGFCDFRRARGEALEDHARFEALHAHLYGQDPQAWSWRTWPEALRDPRSEAVAAFAAANERDVTFHAFLQFMADHGLANAQRAARGAGMGIGLIADLAVGSDGAGSQVWSRQEEMLTGLSQGAPPDLLNPLGQNWGLTPLSPRGLRDHGYRAFIEMLRATLGHAGGLRIDHVLGLARAWLVPDGADAGAGAYVQFPCDDLLRLVALESWRHDAIVIGEDLGTVPDGFRDRLGAAGLLGMAVLSFTRDADGRWLPPAEWPAAAVGLTGTHDLPTLAGWWSGRDIAWRRRLNLFSADHGPAAVAAERDEDRASLWQALCDEGTAEGAAPDPDMPGPFVGAAISYVGRSAGPLVLLPVEDALAQDEQPNLPGITDPHPNWRRRLPANADRLLEPPAVRARLAALAAARKA